MKSKNEAAMSYELIVFGATISKCIMPEIFRLTIASKAAVERTVWSVMVAQGYTNPGSAMAMVESYLGTGFLCGKC